MSVSISQALDAVLDDIKVVADAKNQIFNKNDRPLGRGENLKDHAEAIKFLREALALEEEVTGTAGGDLAGFFPNPSIAPDAVDNTKLANMPVNTIKGNETGTPTNPKDLSATEVRNLLNIENGAIAGNNFVFAYDTTTQAISNANTYQGINFSNNGPLDGWTHTEGTSIFTCNKAGLYRITLEINLVKASGGNATGAVRYLFNSAEVPGSHRGIDITASSLTFLLERETPILGVVGQDLVLQFAASANTVSISPGPNPGSAAAAIGAVLVLTRFT